MQDKIKIGTRQSDLALAQANLVQSIIKKLYPAIGIEIIKIKTSGDNLPDSYDLTNIKYGGKGLFTKEIEDKLLSKEIDLAIHSMKDVASILPASLTIAAILPRNDPRDALISNKINSIELLDENVTVGTSSIRRKSFITNFKKNIKVVNLRGNVPTRINKLDQGIVDAAILAVSGLNRLNLSSRIVQIISPDIILPAVGQGAIGIEIRKDDHLLLEIMSQINCINSNIEVQAERAFAREFGGDCRTPIAAYARIENDKIILQSAYCDINKIIRLEKIGDIDNADRLGYLSAQETKKRLGF